jgi:lysophospholipase L1-like esterase
MQNSNLSPSTLGLIKKCFLATGVVIILTALFGSSLFSSNPHPDWSRTVTGTLGVFVLISGIVIGRNSVFFRKLSMLFFSLLVAFLFIESAGTMGLFLHEKLSSKPEVDPHEAGLRIRSGVYRPFVIWRANPISEENMTINNDGLRVVPGASDRPSALQVFMFGGSTMVGWKTSDNATICAHIQRYLTFYSNEPVCVTNFGQQGYVNTQELIELQLQLRAGNIPDLVIFYDGTNEIWSAVGSDTAGMHFNFQEIAYLYENRYFVRETAAAQQGFLHLASELNSIHLVKRILGMEQDNGLVIYQEPPSMCILHGEDFVDPIVFAGRIMDIYEGDLRILQALSREFGFEYRVFWQPVVLTGNKPLTPEERDIYDLQDSFVKSLYLECEQLALELESRYDNFLCITDAFDDVNEAVYTDICHLNTKGDSLIAVRICSDLPGISSVR